MPKFEFTTRELTMRIKVDAESEEEADETASGFMQLISVSPSLSALHYSGGDWPCTATFEIDDGATAQAEGEV